jgi:hypothetical protein
MNVWMRNHVCKTILVGSLKFLPMTTSITYACASSSESKVPISMVKSVPCSAKRRQNTNGWLGEVSNTTPLLTYRNCHYLCILRASIGIAGCFSFSNTAYFCQDTKIENGWWTMVTSHSQLSHASTDLNPCSWENTQQAYAIKFIRNTNCFRMSWLCPSR